MMLKCTNKGCGSYDEHLLDKDSGPNKEGRVICIECGESIDVPTTTITMLKTLGQIRKSVKSGLQFVCRECGNKDRPVLKKLSATQTIAICKKCSQKLDVQPAFIQALKVIKADTNDEEPITRKKK